MKPRRVVVTVELESADTVNEIKAMIRDGLAELEGTKVKQVQANVIQQND